VADDAKYARYSGAELVELCEETSPTSPYLQKNPSSLKGAQDSI